MTDSWTDSNGDTLPSDWTPGAPLTPAGDWAGACGCAPADGPSIAKSVVITGSPGAVTSVQNGKSLWSLVLNDGTPAADFRIDRFDDTGALVDSPMTIVRATGVVSFNDSVMLAEDPVEPLEAATKQYVDEKPTGIPDAPNNQTYGRTLGAWNLVVPASGGTFTGQTNLGAGGAVTSGALLFAGNAVCSLPTVAQLQISGGSLGQVPATDGNGNLSWVTPVTGGPYLPIAGGTVTGSLTVNQVLTVQGSNSLVLNAPNGNQRAILGQTSTLTRWQLQLGDGTSEGLNNTGSNFSLTAYATAGGFLGNWLTIARADGSTAFAGPVNMNNGAAVNGNFALQGPGSFILPGGAAGQFLQTNGAGLLSWQTPAGGGGGISEAPTDGQLYGRQSSAWHVVPAGGGISDAPNDGTAYARKSAAWAHLTHTDIADWAATLAPYALTTAVPVASTTTPLMDGTAAVGTGTTWARADHVHPSDTTRAPLASPAMTGVPTAPTAAVGTSTTQVATTAFVAAATIAVMGDNRIINGDMRIDARNNGASGTANGPVYTVDRWGFYGSQVSKLTWGRNLNAVAGPSGFPYYFGFQSASAYASVAADQFIFYQPIEADFISDFAFGAAGAQPVTLSFWARSSLTGTFSGALQNYASTRTYPFSFSLPTANTWTKIIITIPGDTAGTWVMSGNAGSMYVYFDLGSGSTSRGPANAWASSGVVGVTGSVSVVGTNGATFYVTGVKLEIGSVATPFNRQSLAKSLADCQRYFSIGAAVAGGSGIASGYITNTCFFPVAMRASATITPTYSSMANTSAGLITLGILSPTSFYNSASPLAVGQMQWQNNWTASAEL